MATARNTGETKRYRHYTHSPFTLDHQGVKVECKDNGQLIISQESKEGNEVVYDEIKCSASLINRVARMLEATRKVVWKDFPFKNDEEELEEQP